MSSEVASGKPLANGDRLNFARRAYLSELMDGPCSYEELRSCLADLAQVNRVTFAHRLTLRWLDRFGAAARAGHPLHIVDVGSGGGDMLRHIEHWAVDRGIAVRLTGIDLNPQAVHIAREFTPVSSRIRWIVGEAESFDDTADPVDLVISSLFTHHLSDDAIAAFLAWMERVARRGWFINDLYRSRVSYFGFSAMARLARWHRFVQHDGPVSIRRAFRPAEWEQYVEASGLSPSVVQIEEHWPARLCIARVKRQ